MKLTKNILDKAVWALCPYFLHMDRVRFDQPNSALQDCKCEHCPQWEVIDGEKLRACCRGRAEEAVTPVLKALGYGSR